MRSPPVAALLVALAACPTQAAPTHAAPAAPPPGTTEVLDRDPAGHPTLARVSLAHDLPGPLEAAMAMGGTWSYMIRDGDGVTVFDVGPRYPLAWSVVPWPSWKVLTPRLNGNDRILGAVERLFPGAHVTSIVMSHWHADHTEDAPDLQRAAFERWGYRPPLRIAAPDRPLRWQGPLPMGAEAVFYGAGFRRSEWSWGPDLKDGEPLGRTGFEVFAMPGHTEGNIALIDRARRLTLGPPPRVEPPKAEWLSEEPGRYRSTALRFYQAAAGFKQYCTHPAIEAREECLGAPQLVKLTQSSR